MASKKRRRLVIFGIAALTLGAAILGLTFSTAPKTSSGMSLVLKAVHQDETHVKDLGSSYLIDLDGVPHRIDTKQISYSSPSQVAIDRLTAVKQRLGIYDTYAKHSGNSPRGPFTWFEYSLDTDPEGSSLSISFEGNPRGPTPVYLQRITRVTQVEVAIARLFGRPVKDLNKTMGTVP